MHDDRTEAATPKKRQELRRRGRVAKSHDLASLAAFVATVVCLHSLAAGQFGLLRVYFESVAGMLGNADLTPGSLSRMAAEMGDVLRWSLGPVMLTAMAIGILANVAQTGPLFSTQVFQPDFNRLNPLAGFRRFFSGQGVFETAKATAKLSIVGVIGYSTVMASYPQLMALSGASAVNGFQVILGLLYTLSLRVGLFLLVLSTIDYAYQRYSFEKSIRMTKQEVKEEHKQQEGSPQTRARIRSRQRQMARQRMMQDVPSADVVITNPTHFAVALKYETGTMVAPKVVAKGADLIAKRIREIAEANRVPLVSNPPLARALFRQVEIGREIPSTFYAAVAEVLAYVYSLNRQQPERSASGAATPGV